MTKPTKQGINSLKDAILEKANIILHFQDKPTVLLPVGTEWGNPDFASGLHLRVLESVRENLETTAIKVDGLARSSMAGHYHDNREAIMCLKGLVRLRLPKKEILLQALEHYIIPSGVVHSLEFLEDSLLLVAWHPKFD